MAKPPVRKIDINAFPEKLTIIPEMSLSRKDLKRMYETMVGNVNYFYAVEDGVELTKAEMLEFVDEAKFAAIVAAWVGKETRRLTAEDILDQMCGYELEESIIPSAVVDIIKKQPSYKARVKSTEDLEREREIARVIAHAERLGLAVTR